MPDQAFALKKYRCGRSPVSKISDNEDATAPLGNSEVLSVENAVGEPIPEFAQRPEEGAKIPSAVAGQYARDVFPDRPPRPVSVGDRSEEHTSELQSLMRISYAVFCLKKKKTTKHYNNNIHILNHYSRVIYN